jgi:hypothetical protein
MNRNQKIAAGFGAAACLGLIVVVIVYLARPNAITMNRQSNFNVNANESSNSNSAATSESGTPSSSMSDDDKHKLYMAVLVTNDSELTRRVLKKLGLIRADGAMTTANDKFAGAHIDWWQKNLQFRTSVNTPEKARAYVEAHIDD